MKHNIIKNNDWNVPSNLRTALAKVYIPKNSFVLNIGSRNIDSILNMVKYYHDARIYAVDADAVSLNQLRKKIDNAKLSHRIFTLLSSEREINFLNTQFDLILIEGIANLKGFEKGIDVANKLLKERGVLIMRCENNYHLENMKMLRKNNYFLLNYLLLDMVEVQNDCGISKTNCNSNRLVYYVVSK